jgi:hypothetical protein
MLKMSLEKTPSLIIKELTQNGGKGGEPWSYYDFSKHLQDNDIDGVSIITNNEGVSGLLAIDKTHQANDFMLDNVHLVKTIPDLVQPAITQLEKMKVLSRIHNF